MENPKLKFINTIESAQTGNVTARHCKAPEPTEFPLEFPADGKEPMHATAITINGSRYMDSIGKFQLSEIKFGFCFLFSAIINFVSTFKRLDHCVKVWSTQRHLKFMKSAVNLEVKTGNYETVKKVAVSTFRQDTNCALSCLGIMIITGKLLPAI